MMPFSLFLALRYLRPRRNFISVVTVISVLGVLIGVAILIIVLSVMSGFDEMWREKILSFKPHLVVTARNGAIDDDEHVTGRILALPFVRGAAACVETRALAQYGGWTVAPVVIGMDPSRAAAVSRVSECIRRGTFDLNGENTVVGIDLAMQLGLNTGDVILVYSPLNAARRDEIYLPIELKVEGIFDMGMRDYDAGFMLTSLDAGRELVGLDSGAHAVYVMTDDPFRFDEYASRVRDTLGSSYEVRTWKEIDTLLFQALSHEKTMMFVLLVFITIVAIFCVTNTLIVMTVQKTDEIGLLKALGFKPGQIMAVFIWHGWMQCMAGSVGGVAAGFLILKNLRRIVSALASFNVRVFPKEIYGLSEIPWSISWQEVAGIAAFVMVFCTISSILPALRAARLDPVEALRHE